MGCDMCIGILEGLLLVLVSPVLWVLAIILLHVFAFVSGVIFGLIAEFYDDIKYQIKKRRKLED